jgi:predicted P-loop ATPase
LKLIGGPLEDRDYAALEARWITRELADSALLRRVDHAGGLEMLGYEKPPTFGAKYSGMVIPYLWPGDDSVRARRLRRDEPDLERDHHNELKPRKKYVGEAGRRNSLYLHPQTEQRFIDDASLPIVIVEGEFKTLALWRLAWHGLGDSADMPAWLPVGLQGVYSWRGKLGREEGEKAGEWRDVKGPVPDLGRFEWGGRKVVILFDTNVEQADGQVAMARRALTAEVEARGGIVSWVSWPKDLPANINGIDDYLAAYGAAEGLRLISRSKKVTRKRKVAATVTEAIAADDWTRLLIRSDSGGVKAILANVMTYLQHDDVLAGMVSYDEFAVRVMALQGTPWNATPREWGEVDDIRLAHYLQQQKQCHAAKATVADAVAAVARERSYHPVREYLAGLTWDEVPRLDTWMPAYLGARDEAYARAVGARWMISAVARVMQPGVQADHCLILQGEQGARKSSALRALAGEWFTDQVGGDLSQKDSAQAIAGVWIVEFGELEQVVGMRAEMATVKAFITRRVDRYRPPYERRPADFPRQCVFAGSVNQDEFLRDETGGRRFWPVKVSVSGPIDVDALERDRDQLWAEARARYGARELWYMDTPELVALAREQQEERFERDAWDGLVWDWVLGARSGWVASGRPVEVFRVTIGEILKESLKKPEAAWTQMDRRRVGHILRVHGLVPTQQRVVDDDDKPVLGPNGSQLRQYYYEWPRK